MASDIVYKVLDRISGAGLLATGLLLLTALVSAVVAYWRTVENKSWKEFFEFASRTRSLLIPRRGPTCCSGSPGRRLMPFLMLPAGIVFVIAVGYATNWLLSTLLQIHPPLIEGPAGPVTVVDLHHHDAARLRHLLLSLSRRPAPLSGPLGTAQGAPFGRGDGRHHQGPRPPARRIDEPGLGRRHPRHLLRHLDADLAEPRRS